MAAQYILLAGNKDPNASTNYGYILHSRQHESFGALCPSKSDTHVLCLLIADSNTDLYGQLQKEMNG